MTIRTTSPRRRRARTRVAKRLIRSKDGGGGGSDRLEEGDKVEADYRGRGPRKISRDRGDDTDISYDDGERVLRRSV